MIAHMIQRGIFHNEVVFEGVLADQRNLLILRAVAFSLFPLLLGIQHVRLSGQVLSRKTLWPMFYAQCYVTVPFVLMLDLAMMLSNSTVEWAKPGETLADIRLDAARVRLLSGGQCVTQCALDSGISHLGRFAHAYCRRFGDGPGQTLAAQN